MNDLAKNTTIVLKSISTKTLKKKLNNKSWIIVDTRIGDAYNGWKLDGVKRGGHIEGAVDLPANWIKVEAENKEELLSEALDRKNITSDKNVVLYDSNSKDVKVVAKYLSKRGFKNIFSYYIKEWAKDEKLPMESYKEYHLIVPPSIVKEVVDGKTPETFKKGKNIKIVEASWGDEYKSYAKGHVPTSFHINTDSIELPSTWMLASDKELEKFALKNGSTKDDAVIVTGENVMASYRIATVLKYIGVSDVRVLNGGITAWKLSGYNIETKRNKPTPVYNFGYKIPLNFHIIDSIDEVKIALNKSDKFTLVDNRTWK